MMRALAVALAMIVAGTPLNTLAADAAFFEKSGKSLCKTNEVVVLSFRISRSTKTASVCKERVSDYLVYRFGRRDSVELQYPSTLDPESWTLFELHRDRDGTIGLSFDNDGQKYAVFQKLVPGRETPDSILLVGRGDRIPLMLQSEQFDSIGRLGSIANDIAWEKYGGRRMDEGPSAAEVSADAAASAEETSVASPSRDAVD